MQNLNQQIDKLLGIIVDTVLGAKAKEEAVAVPLWPIPTPQGMLYWGEAWSKKLNRILHLIDQQQVSKEDIKKAIKFPSRLVHILWRIDAIKNSDLNKEERLYTIEKLFDYLVLFRKKNLFCENGKNIIWGLEELENKRKGLFFFDTRDTTIRRVLFNLEASLLLYTELIYWANHPIGHSFHGPYEDKGDTMLIREYFDLRPEVWEFARGLSFSEIEVFEIYNQGTEIELDFFERGIRTTEAFKEELKSIAIKVDDKPIQEAKALSKLFGNLSKITQEGSDFIQTLSKQKLIKKHAQYWFYTLKPLCDLVREDWYPPREVIDNIFKRFQEINNIWENVAKKNFEKTANLSYQEQAEIIKEAFDPRK